MYQKMLYVKNHIRFSVTKTERVAEYHSIGIELTKNGRRGKYKIVKKKRKTAKIPEVYTEPCQTSGKECFVIS